MAKAAKAFTGLQKAHQVLVAQISATTPNNITLLATADALQARKEHLSEVLNAALAYAKALIDDTNEVSPTKVADHTDYLEDAISDVIGGITHAARRLEAA